MCGRIKEVYRKGFEVVTKRSNNGICLKDYLTRKADSFKLGSLAQTKAISENALVK